MTQRGRVVVPEHWKAFFNETEVPAAVLVGDDLRVSGHSGEYPDGSVSPDVTTQIRQTFTSLGETLAEAGFGWADVVELTSYHVGLQDQAAPLLTVAAEFLPRPFPAWTAVGVTELFVPGAVVEIALRVRR